MIATGKAIRFIPFDFSENKCRAKVFLVEENKDDLDIGRALVGLGFAIPAPYKRKLDPEVDPVILETYVKQIKSTERRAKALRKGLWSFTPESWLRWKVRTTIEKLVFQMKPLHKKIPAVIR